VRRPSRPVKATCTRPLVGPLICTTSSSPCSVSLTRIDAFGGGGPVEVPGPVLPGPEVPGEPPELLEGTLTIVCAAFAELLLPAALVSHTAMFQLPGPGAVTAAGPFGGCRGRWTAGASPGRWADLVGRFGDRRDLSAWLIPSRREGRAARLRGACRQSGRRRGWVVINRDLLGGDGRFVAGGVCCHEREGVGAVCEARCCQCQSLWAGREWARLRKSEVARHAIGRHSMSVGREGDAPNAASYVLRRGCHCLGSLVEALVFSGRPKGARGCAKCRRRRIIYRHGRSVHRCPNGMLCRASNTRLFRGGLADNPKRQLMSRKPRDDAGFPSLAGRAAEQAADVGKGHGACFATDDCPVRS
jgi:hypothetical protein